MGTLARCCALLGVLATSAAAAPLTVPGTYPSIQSAIDGAPDGAVIEVAPGVYHESLVLSGITRTLTLRGNPADPASVVVDGSGRPDAIVLVVSSGSDVTIDGFTFRGGRGGHNTYGGGLYMTKSSATFRHCVFADNQATGDGGGAFIVNSGGFFEDCVFEGNTAGGFGGGILVNGSHNFSGPMIFNRVRFSGNTAGASQFVNGWGGGLYVTDSSPIMVGCEIDGNTSHYAAGGLALLGHDGVAHSRMTVVDTTITNNEVIPSGIPRRADGGGIHVEANASLRLERAVLRGNRANSGGGIGIYQARVEIVDGLIEQNVARNTFDGEEAWGGGIWASSVATPETIRPASVLTLVRSVVRDNTATVAGGMMVQGDFSGLTQNRATLAMTDSVVSGNVASHRGGGLYIERSEATISGSMILDNEATASWGGGMLLAGSSRVSVGDSTFAGNRAPTHIGGAIMVDQGGELNVIDSRFLDNKASFAPGKGGASIAVSDVEGPIPGPTTGLVTGSVFLDNEVKGILWEANCRPEGLSQIVYRDNVLHNLVGLYYRNCGGGKATVADFNTLTDKAADNVDATPAVVDGRTAPGTIMPGGTAVLAVATMNAGAAAATPTVGTLTPPADVVSLAPVDPTTYAVTTQKAPTVASTVHVMCPGLAMPLPVAPGNGYPFAPVGEATLRWAPAEGATTYDVYFDAVDEPTTLVAADVTVTSVTVPTPLPGTTYRWKVVAKSAVCPDPRPSPTVSFATCDGHCKRCLTFDDGSVDGFTAEGRGAIAAPVGALLIDATRKLLVTTPVTPIRDGELSFVLTFTTDRPRFRMTFTGDTPTTYTQLVFGRRDQIKLVQRDGGRVRRVSRLRHVLTAGRAMVFRVQVANGVATMSLDGQAIARGVLPQTPNGLIRMEAVGTKVLLDDVCVERD